MKQTLAFCKMCLCAKMQTGSKRGFSHKTNAGRVIARYSSLMPVLKSVSIQCLVFSSVKNLMSSHETRHRVSHSICHTGSGFSQHKMKEEEICCAQSYLVIISPLLWHNDKGSHIRNGHLYSALARGLILCDLFRRGGRGSTHLDFRLRGGGRGKRL